MDARLKALMDETLVQKHKREMREKCPHEKIYRSTVTTPDGSSTTKACLDCGKSWHSEDHP